VDVVDAGAADDARLRADPAIRARVKKTKPRWPMAASPGAGAEQIAEMLK